MDDIAAALPGGAAPVEWFSCAAGVPSDREVL
jgi:hypothetical protein